MATVAPDTSFLFSLFGGDAFTATARLWAAQAKQPIAVTALNRYEFENSVRFAVFRKVVSREDALNSLAAFDSDLRSGNLQPAWPDLADIVKVAARLSKLHTMDGGHRSFDILHVAAAQVIKATLFLSFDVHQRKLADALKLAVGP